MMNSRSNKLAMTLAEILICICIVGVIAAITIPVLRQAMPSKEDSFRKKANYLVEQVVSQLYGDEIMYPKKSDFYSQGFQNTEKVTINGVEYEGNDKFCKLFASKFMISSESGELVCENQIAETSTTLARGKRSFRAKDGVDWYLPVTDFQKGAAEIMVDVNGDELPNCLEGATGCNNPDRFLYYVKADGAITYTKPDDVIKDKFRIIVDITTDGCNTETGVCDASEVGGTCQYATLNNDGSHGSFHNVPANGIITNLNPNTRYILQAKPKTNYYVDWSTDPNIKAPAKRVKIYNSDLKLDLKFHKKAEHCIVIDIPYCAESNPTRCVEAKLTTGCGYVESSAGENTYKLEDGAFIYVGIGHTEATHAYKCGGIRDVYGNVIPSNTYKFTEVGHPIKTEDGFFEGDVDTAYTNSLFMCDGLTTGDYKLVVTPQSGYTVTPTSVDYPKGRYEQDVRLGTEDLNFEVDLSR